MKKNFIGLISLSLLATTATASAGGLGTLLQTATQLLPALNIPIPGLSANQQPITAKPKEARIVLSISPDAFNVCPNIEYALGDKIKWTATKATEAAATFLDDQPLTLTITCSDASGVKLGMATSSYAASGRVVIGQGELNNWMNYSGAVPPLALVTMTTSP